MMKTELYLCEIETELHLIGGSIKTKVYGIWDSNSPLSTHQYNMRGKVFLFAADMPDKENLSDIEYNNLYDEIEDELIDDRYEGTGSYYIGQEGWQSEKLDDSYNFKIPDFDEEEEAYEEYEKQICIVTDGLGGDSLFKWYDVTIRSKYADEGG